MKFKMTRSVIPAKAGIQCDSKQRRAGWIPASAGMTNKFVILALAIVIAGAVLAAWYFNKPEKALGALDEFAKCLAEKQITMYGAYWCPHCQNEKKAFGDSFQYVPYVECTVEPEKCRAAGVQYFPTWIFPASPAGGPEGKRLTGEQGIEKLAGESGCRLPKED